MVERGVIHGRFQILHNDHLRYILRGKELCRHLILAITNPDPLLSREENADPLRSDPLNNPMTYYERYVMIRRVMEESCAKPSDYSVVPFPVSRPDLYRFYVPMDATFFLSIYDDWGRKKFEYFSSLGLKTHILRDVESHEKGISGREVREKMLCGGSWETMVPPSVALLMKQWRIPERLRKLEKDRTTKN
jgi:nicotinamide mononucleotide adenylyltransferase